MYFDERDFDLNKQLDDINLDYINLNLNSSEENNNFDLSHNAKYDINNININNYGTSRANKLNSVEKGFNKGTMFDDIYNGYKNYSYKVVVNGERQKKLLEIQELKFASKDINLYLDVYPDDLNVYDEYKIINKELKNKISDYEKKYGPLTACNTNNMNYDWINCPWPWDRGEN